VEVLKTFLVSQTRRETLLSTQSECFSKRGRGLK